MRRHALPFVLSCALVLAARPAIAQGGDVSPTTPRSPYAAALVVGFMEYGPSDAGVAPMVGARAEAELRPWLVAEGALGYAEPEDELGERSGYVIPEVQLQLQIPSTFLRPYVGVGGGVVLAEGQDMRGTLSLAGGVRVPLSSSRVHLRGELRSRGLGAEFGSQIVEWTLGVGYRF
jgi:hypothetical protein